jgi:hypothetical protein
VELAAGTRVGPYEIDREVGRGGMGVVYAASDTRLGRKVALKLLPAAVRDDADRLRRFEQEARTIGGLNHPNLVTLHDVGRHDGAPYLVTELLDGSSLRGRIANELPIRECVRIAAEVARGLAAAHGAGIVHRDIKPDNLFVTRDGRVKILDFGIAKLRRDDGGDVAQAETLAGATEATGIGAVVGTPGYMAPEQLGGGAVDARTDLFALGVVMFEMLARKRLPAGFAQPELPATVPVPLARIVQRCLEVRPEARFQSASDLAFALDAYDAPASSPSLVAVPVPTTAVKPAPRRPLALRTLGALVVVLVLVLGAWKVTRTKPNTILESPRVGWPSLVEGGPVYRRITYHTEPRWYARFAPDASAILYSSHDAGGSKWRVERAELGSMTITPVDADGRLLDISRDGALALREPEHGEMGGLLAVLRPGMGAPRELAKQISVAAFGADDDTLAVVRNDGAGMTLEYPIGKVIARRDTSAFRIVRVSRDGSRLAVVEQTAPPDTRGHVIVFDRAGKELARSADYAGVEGLAWSPDGREAWFSTDNVLRAIAPGAPDRVVLRDSLQLSLLDVAPAPDGRILVAPTDMRVYAFAGAPAGPRTAIGWRDSAHVLSISRDGGMFALLEAVDGDVTPDGYGVYVRHGDQPPVPLGHAFNIQLVPDGSAALLLCGARAPLRLVPIGAGVEKDVHVAPVAHFDLATEPVVSEDGKHVYARGAVEGQPMRLWAFDLAGDAPPQPIGPAHIDAPDVEQYLYFAVSPDGAWLALPGSSGVRLVPTTGAGKERALPAPRAESPIRFSADGKSLFAWPNHGWPRSIARIDVATGARKDVAAIDVPDKPERVHVHVSGNAEVIAFSYKIEPSDLYVLEKPQ